jgi:hypothetical protein
VLRDFRLSAVAEPALNHDGGMSDYEEFVVEAGDGQVIVSREDQSGWEVIVFELEDDEEERK